ncbi:hypothetical protein [Cetobacterium sp. ZWU0022]|uniref:hypothetical protein n=1 Tax=Cetobacterium sp. ZWU0022 TaxID=1340502 RepID=UPI000647BCED|nr:hypothetical protein [Cetobacterium sp. ZWU0022]
MKKIAKSINFTQVIEVEFEIIDEKCPMPVRVVKQYQTLEGKIIGIIDPMDNYSLVNIEYSYKK